VTRKTSEQAGLENHNDIKRDCQKGSGIGEKNAKPGPEEEADLNDEAEPKAV